jgi:hypothetical protein
VSKGKGWLPQGHYIYECLSPSAKRDSGFGGNTQTRTYPVYNDPTDTYFVLGNIWQKYQLGADKLNGWWFTAECKIGWATVAKSQAFGPFETYKDAYETLRAIAPGIGRQLYNDGARPEEN